ncbi:MAG: glycogen debranching enzyme GlgX, partial [Pseudomonadota bacterium]
PGGYQLGNFPPGWSELNDRFRDTARLYWRGDEGMLPELAGRLAGSSDFFEHQGRRPWASVNKITSHDGFTLQDVVSYDRKHNEANLESNHDGHGANNSWNHGVEGPTDDPAVTALRERQKRNLLATLLLAQGTPLLLAGDEFGRTQNGNNNAYCQDNEISWFDWDAIGPKEDELQAFVSYLIELRGRHPVLRRPRFLHGRDVCEQGIKDITWLTSTGEEKTDEKWQMAHARSIGVMLNGRAGHYVTADGAPADDDILLMLLNAYDDVVRFVLPAVPDGERWRRLLDTFDPAAGGAGTHHPAGEPFQLAARSLALFALARGSRASDLSPGG